MTNLLTVFVSVSFLKIISCKYMADEVNSVLYDMSISAFPLNEEAKNEDFLNVDFDATGTKPSVTNDLLAIGNKHGQKYHCRVPTFVERPPGSDEGLLEPPPSSRVTNEQIKDALDPILKGLCLKNTREKSGWWTYEVCHKDAATQYHIEGDKRQGETIYLGHFESEKDWSTAEAISELRSKRKKTLHHSHFFTNGTLCDVTNRLRRAEVRFMCNEDLHSGGAFLHSVDEPESCDYILTIYTAALCRLPAFLPIDRKPAPLKIECQPVLSSHEYDKYVKAKEAEEAKKAEKAALKKQEQDTKQQDQADTKKQPKPEPKHVSEADLTKPSTTTATTTKDGPILDILGRPKAAFLKSLEKQEAKAKDGSGDHKPETSESEDSRIIGSFGTIEYEYMTRRVEEELENMSVDEELGEDEEDDDAEIRELTEAEKALNESKRKTRRSKLFVNFLNRLEDMVDDVFFTITQYDSRVKELRGEHIELAKQEIESALTVAWTNIVAEMDDVEREMELLGDNTGTSGLAAFRRMREMLQGRHDLMKEFDDSGLDAKEFVNAKIASFPPVTEGQMKKFEKAEAMDKAYAEKKRKEAATAGHDASESETGATSAYRQMDGAMEEENRSGRPDQNTEKPVLPVKSSSLLSDGGDKTGSAMDSSRIGEQHAGNANADQTKISVSPKRTFRQEMESHLGNIIGDVERELKGEGAFDELNEEEIAEVKTEAFRSLAKTLTNLLEKLDDAEQDVNVATNELENTGKKTVSTTMHLSTSKREKAKDTEKRLNIWRKLAEGLDDQEQSDSDDTSERKPLGKIQIKRGEQEKSASEDGVRVRVSTFKQAQGKNADESEETSGTSKLERRLAEKLKDAGFDTQGRPVQVKIIANFDLDENSDSLVHALSDEESEQFTNVIYAILGGGGTELTAEQRRQQRLEESYNFGTNSESGSSKENKAPMKTVVVGAGP